MCSLLALLGCFKDNHETIFPETSMNFRITFDWMLFQYTLVQQLVIRIFRSFWNHSISWSLLHNPEVKIRVNMQHYWQTVNYSIICA